MIRKILKTFLILVLFLITVTHCAKVKDKKEITEKEVIIESYEPRDKDKIISGSQIIDEEDEIQEYRKSKALPMASVPLPE